MDKIVKALHKLSASDRAIVKKILISILHNKWQGLDVKKLKNYDTVFRIRKGKLRIIINKMGDNIKVIKIEKRNDKTYKFNS